MHAFILKLSRVTSVFINIIIIFLRFWISHNAPPIVTDSPLPLNIIRIRLRLDIAEGLGVTLTDSTGGERPLGLDNVSHCAQVVFIHSLRH